MVGGMGLLEFGLVEFDDEFDGFCKTLDGPVIEVFAVKFGPYPWEH